MRSNANKSYFLQNIFSVGWRHLTLLPLDQPRAANSVQKKKNPKCSQIQIKYLGSRHACWEITQCVWINRPRAAASNIRQFCHGWWSVNLYTPVLYLSREPTCLCFRTFKVKHTCDSFRPGNALASWITFGRRSYGSIRRRTESSPEITGDLTE